MNRLLTSAAMASVLCAGAYAHSDAQAEASADTANLTEAVEADYVRSLEALFKHFHANPELSHREYETAKRLAQEIEAFGYTVTTGVGGTGVVAVMENGAGPTVLLRADMDGLPVPEKSGLDYASTARQKDIDGIVKPVMHACGHDVHMTALVGAARQLAQRKDQWSGTLVLIGQPAEERISGARNMLKDGLYERFPKPDYALAFHVAAGRPEGKIYVPQAIAYSSSDSVDITVRGVGAHGASPHKGVDPVLVASQIVVSLQSVVSRSIAPLQPGVITVGSIHGGFKHNIIPEEVKLQLTVRSDDPETRTALLDGIDRVAEGTARALDVPEDLLPEVVRSPVETTPPTLNDAVTAKRIDDAFRAHFGAERMYDDTREGMGAEDFAYFVAPEYGVKGVYFSVGGTPEAELQTAAGHHSPLFKVSPEPSVTAGVEAMTLAAMTLLAVEPGEVGGGD
ncbi:MAG: amidohydrolase [Maricaulaceae bacterium]